MREERYWSKRIEAGAKNKVELYRKRSPKIDPIGRIKFDTGKIEIQNHAIARVHQGKNVRMRHKSQNVKSQVDRRNKPTLP